MVRAALSTRPALLALIAAGCVDFGLVAPGARSPAYVRISAAAIHDETLTVEVDVLVITGLDAGGRPYQLPDPSIYVNGTAVQPASSPEKGMYEYRTTINPPEPIDLTQLVYVLVPALTPGGAPAPALRIPFVGRRGDDTLRLSPGEDLVLGLAVPAAVPNSDGAEWMLALRNSCTGLDFVRLNASGWPPPTLTVPWGILQQLAPAEFEACLDFVLTMSPPAADYMVYMGLWARAQWHVEIR